MRKHECIEAIAIHLRFENFERLWIGDETTAFAQTVMDCNVALAKENGLIRP
jgi:hypothetical protein